jgi:TonB family protein
MPVESEKEDEFMRHDQVNRRHLMRWSVATAIAVMGVIFSGIGVCAFGQSATSTVAGVVHDQLGGGLPDTKVTLARLDDQRSQPREMLSSQDGSFKFEYLPAGDYVLEAFRHSAQKVQRRITVRGGQQVRQDIGINLLPIEEQLTVTNRPADIHPQDARKQVGGRRDCVNSSSGECLVPAILSKRVAPQYPDQLAKSNSEGTAVVGARIASDGSLVAVHVLSAEKPEFAQAAVAAVSKWQFEPTLLNGEPVETAITVTVNFKILR